MEHKVRPRGYGTPDTRGDRHEDHKRREQPQRHQGQRRDLGDGQALEHERSAPGGAEEHDLTK